MTDTPDHTDRLATRMGAEFVSIPAIDQTAQSDEVVTQEDREAAAAYWKQSRIGTAATQRRYLTGGSDASFIVQAFARHRLASTATLQASLDEVRAENARLREAVAKLRSVTTNDEGLLPCPECDSLTGPHLYWWSRGQAWIVICQECKHEEGREGREYLARDVWNKAARDALKETAS